MDEGKRKASVYDAYLYNMSPTEIALYAREAKAELRSLLSRCEAAEAEVKRLMEIKFNSGSFGPYIFGMDVAGGMETTVVSRIEEDGTITVIDELRRRAAG